MWKKITWSQMIPNRLIRREMQKKLVENGGFRREQQLRRHFFSFPCKPI